MEKILIRRAEASEAEEIYKFKCSHFDLINPIEIAYPDKSRAGRNIQPIISAIADDIVLMAIEQETKKLVGVLIAAAIKPNYIQKFREMASTPDFQKMQDIYGLAVYVEETANLFEKYNFAESLRIDLAIVHPEHRGQKIATKLFQSIFDIALTENHKLMSIACSSVYSARISESFGMDCLATVTYAEYNEHIGKAVFTPVEPHMEIKVYAKEL